MAQQIVVPLGHIEARRHRPSQATRRAIDFQEGDKIDEKALKALIRAAVALNMNMSARATTRAKVPGGRSQKRPKSA